MANTSQYSTSIAPLTGRILVAALFLASGIGKVEAPTETLGYIASVGIPQPMLAYAGAVMIELLGGLLLLFGYRARYTSLVLAAYCVVTAFLFHHALHDQDQFFHFMKNLAIAGGALDVVRIRRWRLQPGCKERERFEQHHAGQHLT